MATALPRKPLANCVLKGTSVSSSSPAAKPRSLAKVNAGCNAPARISKISTAPSVVPATNRMSLLNSTPNRIRKAICFALQLATGALALHAATITNVNVVNVTPSSFSLVWRTSQSSASEVQVFADAGGQSNITTALGVEFYPLHTGNPNFLEGYERRQSRVDLKDKTKSLGLVHAKVRNGQPGATYYYKILSSSGGTTNTFPTVGTAAVQLP